MKDYITIGTTPHEEPCAQVGTDNYTELARIEAAVFVRQMLRIMGNPPAAACFTLKWFPHDFGSYGEVAVVFDDQNEAAINYAYDAEGRTPERWDDQARAELTAAGYPLQPSTAAA